MDDCPFCGIVAGDRDAHVLYEDDLTVAFLDERPATRGHVLVVPTEHVTDLLRADEPSAVATLRTARAVADALETVLEPDGFSLFHTAGDLVGSVEHAHLHVLPRCESDRIRLALDRTDLGGHDPAALTEQLRRALAEG